MLNRFFVILVCVFSCSLLHADMKLAEANKKTGKEASFIKKQIESLSYSINTDKNDDDGLIYKHIVKDVSENGQIVTLEDEMEFTVDWWYRGISNKWKKGDQIFITYDFTYEQLKLQHATSQAIVWVAVNNWPFEIPTITNIPDGQGNPDAYSKITLSNGYVFKAAESKVFGKQGWQVKDPIIVFANSATSYQVWNMRINAVVLCQLVGMRKPDHKSEIKYNDVLELEARLNKKVLQQEDATGAVAASMLIYSAGFKEKHKPVGVFLFLGPTGVGKTELAKALTQDLYKDSSKMLRFDMSHFTEPHSLARLIGSPPGYANHEEGGQLTEPLIKDPQTVVLLDEIEKAHTQVHKIFLPIFDEGYIHDSKNLRVDCSNVIFIMTSNLCGPEIADLYHKGYSSQEILAAIEPKLIQALSPELYNRVEPVLFQPLEEKTMGALVDLLLGQTVKKIWEQKEIKVVIDDSLRTFLIENGYHHLLGARPLKKLIEKRVVAALATSVIMEKIEEGTLVTLVYDDSSDSVLVIRGDKVLEIGE